MERVAACWGTAYCRKNSPFTEQNKENISPSCWGHRDFTVLQNPPSHLCNNCRRELGTPGMLSLGTLPGSQLAALLLLGVNERNWLQMLFCLFPKPRSLAGREVL